jgi:diguanylate cyclase (GGDEF)-like protein
MYGIAMVVGARNLSHEFFKLTAQNYSRILFFLLLISCKSNALQSVSKSEFDTFLQKAELLINSDPKAALALLNSFQDDINTQPITSQVNYYRIQSEAYADQALYTLSEASAEIGLKLTKQMNSPSILIAELAFTKGFAVESLGDLTAAFQLYQNGLDVARSMNDEEFIAHGLINIGAIYYLRKNYKQSLIALNQALQLANRIKDEALLGDITSELGILYGYLGEEDQANSFFQKSYHHYKKVGKHNYALNSLHNVAINHANDKRYEQALVVYRVLESEIQPNTSNEFIFGVYRSLAWALLNKDDADIENAYRYTLLAGEYVKDVEQHRVKLQYRIDKAYILEKMARYEEALVNIEQAQVLFEQKAKRIYDTSELNILSLKAKLYYALGRHNQAYDIQKQYFVKAIAYKEARDTSEIDELRLQYESETVDRQKDILKQKQSLQNFQLQQLTQEASNRKILTTLLAVCILMLAWFLQRIIKGQKHLLKATRTDSLTGVVNRRRILQIGEKYFNEAKVKQQTFSVCMIDVDFFKQVNDEFGHQIGDCVLKEIAQYGQGQMRGNDVFGRFGGEEFIALLPDTKHEKAFEVAQRVRASIEQAKWQVPAINQLTVSVGISSYEAQNYDDFSALLKAADAQLLQAKKAGRNKVI